MADGLGKAKNLSGLGLGDGWVALVFGLVIVVLVAYLAIAKRDEHVEGSAIEGAEA